MNNVIKAIIDVSVKGSNELKSLKTQFSDADGARGKFGVGMGALKQHVAEAALFAGTAIAGFAIKAIGDFQDLALEVGKFSDRTGVLPEDASRLIEVFGDVGVESEAVRATIEKMNKQLGASPEAFEQLGLKAIYAKDGVLDSNATFIAAIEHLGKIENPARRAAEGTRIFGKQWGELAEVVESGNIREALDAVSDAKIIDQAEVDKARKMRDALDELKGFAEDATLAVGGQLVPAISDMTEEFSRFIETVKAGDIGEITDSMNNLGESIVRFVAPGFGELNTAMDSLKDPGVALAGSIAPDLIDKFGKVGESAEDAGTAVGDSALAYLEMQRGMQKADEAAKALDDRIGALTDTVNAAISADLGYKSALNNTEDAMIDLFGKVQDLNKAQGEDRVAAVEAMERAELNATEAIVAQSAAAVKLWEDQVLAAGGTLSQADAARIQRDELIKVASTMDPNSTLAKNLWGYVDMLGNIPGVVSTTINIENSEALRRIAEVRGKLNEAAILADTYGMGKSRSSIPERRTGGPMSAGKPYITHADELVVPDEDKHVFSAAQTAQIMGNSGSGTPLGMGSGGSGVTINLTVHAGMLGQDVPRMAVEALRQAVQSMGATTVQKAIGL